MMTHRTQTSIAPLRSARTTKALWLTWRAAWTEAWSNKRSFWAQSCLMIVNNLFFVVFWLVFFNEVRSLRGWDEEALFLLFATFATAAGIVLGMFHNLRQIGNLVADGELDATLSLPVPTLAHLCLRRIEPVSLGDFFFGLGLFAFMGSPTPVRFLIFVFGVVVSAVILAGFFIMIGSLGFFAGRGDSADMLFHSVLLFGQYPVDIFPGLIRLFLYAVMPAAFLGAVPAKLMLDFDPLWAVLSVLVAVGFVSFGSLCFGLGLRRYTSGAVWTTA